MRTIFMGTPAFAVPILTAIADAGHDIVAVYTQPPRPAGRGKAPMPSPVQIAAEAHGLPVHAPVTLRDEAAQAAFAAHGADVAVVAAYGLILPRAVLAAPRLGCINVHASLLPRWRGAAPIQRAILAGDAQSGVCIMQMEAGLDTGPVLLREAMEIGGMTAGALTEALATMGARLMVDVLANPSAYPPEPQPDDGVTYAAKIDKAESRIDWRASAEQIERQVRAFNPAPGAFFEHGGERFRLHDVIIVPDSTGAPGTVLDDALTIACGEGAIRPRLIQRAGRAAMAPADLLRGYAMPPGTKLA